MEVSAQAIVARNKHYVGYGRDCTFGCYSIFGRLYFGLRILSHDILDRFTNHIYSTPCWDSYNESDQKYTDSMHSFVRLLKGHL